MIDLPLFEFFSDVRRAGLSLGIGAYLDVRRALRGGFELEGPQSLLELCQLLWASNLDERALIAHRFEQLLIRIPPEGPVPERSGTSRWPHEEPPKTEGPASGRNLEVPTEPKETESGATAPRVVEGETSLEFVEPAIEQAVTARSRGQAWGDYYPLSRRQMKQSWRHLRRSVREGPSTELDFDQTIASLARTGVMLGPVMRPRRVNRAALLLLLDRGGSMVPFHRLCDALRHSASSCGLSGLEVGYFHDSPGEEIYSNPERVDSEHRDRVFSRFAGRNAGVAIVSDGGAARRDFDVSRAAATTAFLSRARAVFPWVVWLNPVPSERWANTTAQRIADDVPMFELTRVGLDRAVDVLRGRRPSSPAVSGEGKA